MSCLLSTRAADADGALTLARFLGADVCGKYLQVVAGTSCDTSNVVVLE